jgi:BsuBI/PstI restriction endonuclease domain/BsuBI/PstI restriction endonuclease HTH domain
MTKAKLIRGALKVLAALGFPRAQQNDRSALTLLALLNLPPGSEWPSAERPMRGITPVMTWVKENYRVKYAPNTRETFRRQTMHQFIEAGLVCANPDNPQRAVNSPGAVYQIDSSAFELLKSFATEAWDENLKSYLAERQTLVSRYAKEREQNRIPVKIADGKTITLSPGEHSDLIREVIENFAQRFLPQSVLLYAGDTGEKWGYFDHQGLESLGVAVDSHGKMPDVVLYWPNRDWLVLVESVTSHGPVNPKRHAELAKLFATSKAGIVFVTAFPNRQLMARYLGDIAWETEVWVADSPSHLIHFNGERFLGPYAGKIS